MSTEAQPQGLVWLITGTSSGFGRELTLAALERGDKVISTARGRSIDKLDELKAKGAVTLELDVTSPLDTLHEVAKKAVEVYGRIDVLVNNAGYISVGVIEAATPEETFNLFNTNVFGALNVTRAFLPYMREKRRGTVLWFGSVGGWRGGPYAGLYCATKWTLRGISESLHAEISPLGLRSLCLDFGYFRTSFLQDGQRAPPVSRIPDYQEITDLAEGSLQAYNGKQPGNPEAAVKLIVDLMHGTGAAEGKEIPISLVFGSDCHAVATDHCQTNLKWLSEWKDVSLSTDFKQ